MAFKIGVDYYPEQWDRSLWESDASRMQQMGIQVVRMMEFAWALLEPEEKLFDFSLFDDAIAVLTRHGLQVVLGTPTATFPAWLVDKDPDVIQVHPTGGKRLFGTRRQPCFNSPTYLKAAKHIVTALAEHYGDSPSVVGWQIDNEIGHEGSDRCVCNNCRKAWHKWLQARYGTIDALNQAWGSVFWGTTLSSFKQAPVPIPQVSSGFNPALLLDYDRFCSDSVVRFVEMQASILRQHIRPDVWLSTNLYPTPHSTAIDLERMTAPLDMVGFDNYPVWGDQDEPMPYYYNAMMLSFVRGLKPEKPFIIFEQFSGMQGHTNLGYLPPEDQVVLWTNQSVARGADQIFYFRWRTAAFGQEQLCYGLFDTDNAPTSRARKLAENRQRNSGEFAVFASQPVPAEACLVYDKDNARLVREQPLSKGLTYSPAPFMQIGYDLELARHYAPYVLFNVNADVQSARSVELERYKVISLPLYQITDPSFVERLTDWVHAGGTLILGWRTGTRKLDNSNSDQVLPGLFTDLAGLQVRRFESLNKTKVGIRIGLVPSQGEVWADILEPTSARALAVYSDKRKHYSGLPCITMNRVGKGHVYYLGTSLGAAGIFLLYRRILKEAGVKPHFHGEGIEVIHRIDDLGNPLDIILNHTPRAQFVRGHRLPAWGMRIVRD